MISRRTSLVLAELYGRALYDSYTDGGTRRYTYYSVDRDKLYDFLYQTDYAAWFCNSATAATRDLGSKYLDSGTRSLKEFVMKLHTGETLAEATPDWPWEQWERLGQRCLHDLAQDVLNNWHQELR